MSQVVRRATQADLSELTDILTVGFAEDPVFTWMFKTEELYRRVAPAYFQMMAEQALNAGQAYLADGKGVLIGQPSSTVDSDAEWNAAGQQKVRNTCGECADNALAYLNAARDNHPMDKPHWYGEYLAVRPSYRNEGIGVLLLRHNFKEQGMAFYLESTKQRNTDTYSRLGFTATRSYKVADGVEMTSMWRDPMA
ncbi:GNAT family N-acetyltransferase [Streptomyces sp. L2]|uniref:GNAT family N-acetyltransferase n=1 Tax=Streptomyces sp. L2 TaxID=2162665 RepID=UPI001012E9E0|nr:GNAT family N-acetyltransferase [Streptomyces sp. L2]